MMKKSIIYQLFSICIMVFIISITCRQIIKVNSSGTKMNYPSVNYTALGWLSETKLAAFVADEEGGVTGYYLESDDHFYSLNVPPFVAMLDCNGLDDINYIHPSLLPDGRLGLINSCKSRDVDPNEKRHYLVAYDFNTKETTLLVKEPLPSYLSNTFTWNPEMTLGLQEIDGGLDGTIYWISPNKIAPVDFAISDGKRSFLPAKDFPRFSDNPEQGIVFSPAWSPNGKMTAFFVTLDAIGQSGFSRSDGEYKIFFMDPLVQEPFPVVGGIQHPSELIWSPDSNWLAFVGEYGMLRTHGLWIYSINSREMKHVASGKIGNIAWSPNGNKITATICEPQHPSLLCNSYEIWEYDVSAIYRK